MSKINKISGFPEWLPDEKLLEERVINLIKGVYESYGFTPIETPAVELVSSLQSKGVIDKEIYLLKRARQEGDEESELALHFDLTVPFARYVAQHFSNLKFPFKRYQLQKVWRGERPQKGRFREFYQFDIDIIAQNDLPLACDAEVVSAVGDVFAKLDIGTFKIRMNSRKLLWGIYQSLGLSPEQSKAAITIVDKIDKIGAKQTCAELESAGMPKATAEKIVSVAGIKIKADELDSKLSEFEINNDHFLSGSEEVRSLLRLVGENARKNILIDLSLARGLDYYTGLIYEVTIEKFPDFGSVCSGGRYDDLASQFINKKLPGVGVSVGLSRLMELIISNNLLPAAEKTKTKVLISVFDEQQRPECNKIADRLRGLQIATEVYYKSPKLGKQIDYAAERGIPWVIFLNSDTGALEVKNLNTKEQTGIADLDSWAASLTAKNAL